MKESLGKTLSGIVGKFNREQPKMAPDAVPDDELCFRLGVKPGHKVCLFHAPKYLLPLFLAGGNYKLTLDWVESDSDAILYWLQPQDDVVDIMTNLEGMIKRSGRIWLILPPEGEAIKRGFKVGWEELKGTVREATSLADNKTLFLSGGECGTQFMLRKAAKEETGAED